MPNKKKQPSNSIALQKLEEVISRSNLPAQLKGALKDRVSSSIGTQSRSNIQEYIDLLQKDINRVVQEMEALVGSIKTMTDAYQDFISKNVLTIFTNNVYEWLTIVDLDQRSADSISSIAKCIGAVNNIREETKPLSDIRDKGLREEIYKIYAKDLETILSKNSSDIQVTLAAIIELEKNLNETISLITKESLITEESLEERVLTYLNEQSPGDTTISELERLMQSLLREDERELQVTDQQLAAASLINEGHLPKQWKDALRASANLSLEEYKAFLAAGELELAAEHVGSLRGNIIASIYKIDLLIKTLENVVANSSGIISQTTKDKFSENICALFTENKLESVVSSEWILALNDALAFRMTDQKLGLSDTDIKDAELKQLICDLYRRSVDTILRENPIRINEVINKISDLNDDFNAVIASVKTTDLDLKGVLEGRMITVLEGQPSITMAELRQIVRASGRERTTTLNGVIQKRYEEFIQIIRNLYSGTEIPTMAITMIQNVYSTLRNNKQRNTLELIAALPNGLGNLDRNLETLNKILGEQSQEYALTKKRIKAQQNPIRMIAASVVAIAAVAVAAVASVFLAPMAFIPVIVAASLCGIATAAYAALPFTKTRKNMAYKALDKKIIKELEAAIGIEPSRTDDILVLATERDQTTRIEVADQLTQGSSVDGRSQGQTALSVNLSQAIEQMSAPEVTREL